jgi:hypothetical protein
MDIEKTFPVRYWINLGRREDRRVETEIALEGAGISATRFPAVDGRFVRKTRGYESAGRYALALTQRMVLRRAASEGADAVLLLEDDVVFHPDLRARLEGMELPEDWGIFYLGCAHRRRPQPVTEGLVRARYALDTHAFAVRAPYYRQVIAALDARRWGRRGHPGASDWYLADLHERVPTYACYPNLAWQAVAKSDLAGGSYSNYTPSGEQVSAAGETVGLQAELWGVPRWHGESRPGDREPKLGLLFLTRGDVNVPEAWVRFVGGAAGEVRIYAHPKDLVMAEAGFLRGASIAERWDTEWGDVSLVRAMLSLLREALRDQSLTHFAFASESCLPLMPWSEMRRRLKQDGRSWIDWQDAGSMQEKHRVRIAGVRDLPERSWRLHPQWCLLARDAAECVAEYDLTGKFERVFAADEHYVGTVLALRGFPEEDRVCRRPMTWTRWSDERIGSFDVIDRKLSGELVSSGCFFARKFLKNTKGWVGVG